MSMNNIPYDESSYIKWWQEKDLKRKSEYFSFLNYSFLVPDSVFLFSENVTLSTKILYDSIPNINNKKILDIGTGCGVLGIICLLNGADHATMTDINSEAINAAKINANQHNIGNKAHIIQCDLFEKIDQKYDLILANLPFVDEAWPQLNDRTATITESFLEQAKNYLEDNGQIITTHASFGNLNHMRQLIKKFEYSYSCLLYTSPSPRDGLLSRMPSSA